METDHKQIEQLFFEQTKNFGKTIGIGSKIMEGV